VRSPYEVLGVSASATASEIKIAYRKLVLKFHPDTSKEPRAAERFIEISEAYEILSDPERRREYDRIVKLRIEREQMAKAKAAATPKEQKPPRPTAAPRPTAPTIDDLLTKLAQQMARGNFAEAEPLAKQILQADPRQAMPYAALGDIARSRGELRQASKMYAYAAQFDPRNPVYLRRHEEVMEAVQRRVEHQAEARSQGAFMAPVVGVMIAVVGAAYVALSSEPSIFPKGSPIGSWTVGLMVMLFLSGVSMGATLALGDLVDRFTSAAQTSSGRISPWVALLSVAIVNFWAATALYLIIGLLQKNIVLSVSRLLIAVIVVTVLLTVGAGATHTIDPYHVLVWGGNLAYIGSICGWMVADSFRE
jgi:curved DNA-binding protein CbpA